MIFWNVDKLKRELSKNKTDQKTIFLYLSGLALLDAIFALPMLEHNYQNSNYQSIEWFIETIFIFISLIGSYYANEGDKGEDFLGRFFSIQFVMSIRYIVFVIGAYILLSLFGIDTESDINFTYFVGIFCFLVTFKSITNIKDVVFMHNQNS